MDELKNTMMEIAVDVGGEPPRGYHRLEDCFTYEPELKALILWYNVDGTTKAVVRSIASSGAFAD